MLKILTLNFAANWWQHLLMEQKKFYRIGPCWCHAFLAGDILSFSWHVVDQLLDVMIPRHGVADRALTPAHRAEVEELVFALMAQEVLLRTGEDGTAKVRDLWAAIAHEVWLKADVLEFGWRPLVGVVQVVLEPILKNVLLAATTFTWIYLFAPISRSTYHVCTSYLIFHWVNSFWALNCPVTPNPLTKKFHNFQSGF